MAYKIRPRVKRDLDSIYGYTTKQFGPDQAIRYHRELYREFQRISNLAPVVWRKYDEISDGLLGYRYKSHTIFFKQVGPNDILIIRVLHKTSDYKKHF